MTNAARQVLSDCRLALEMLESETDLQRWRIHWAAAIALTRAVGHVLDKVDCAADPLLKDLARAAHQRWKKEEEIFTEFIEGERNNLLKEYRFNQHPLEEVEVLISAVLHNQSTGQLERVASVLPIGKNIYRPMLEGFRAGDDARDVLEEALDWWEKELSRLESAMADAKKK